MPTPRLLKVAVASPKRRRLIQAPGQGWFGARKLPAGRGGGWATQGREKQKSGQEFILREAKPGVSKLEGFPRLSGKVQIVSRTLSGLFLVGALNRPRKRKGTNRENPRDNPRKIGKGPKRTKKEGHVQIWKPPRLNTPPPCSSP